MTNKILSFGTHLTILFFLLLHTPVEGAETLFEKAGVQPIKGERMAPHFSLDHLDGKKVELKQYRGKIVFLNFWATWCGPCKEEMPSMEALYQTFKKDHFVFLAISVDYEERTAVKAFIDKHRYTFPVLMDPKGITLDLYKVRGIPATILIDKKGRMIGRVISPGDWNHPDIETLLKKLLGPSPR